MRRRLRAFAAALGLAFFAWISVAVYRARIDPERAGPLGSLVGPGARDLNRAAERRVEAALAALNDTSRPSAERLEAYREELGAAERLFLRSLEANPAQARTLARLAAIRFERSPPTDEAGNTRLVETIAAASRLSPRVPEVQFLLGELLLRMGRSDDGLPYLGRAIEMDSRRARQAVDLLRQHQWKGPEIAAALPKSPPVLCALAGPYLEDGLAREWLGLAEERIPEGGLELLAAYGHASLRAGEAARLESTLERIGRLPEPAIEAERLRHLSSAKLDTGRPMEALEAAEAAVALRPEDAALVEHLGRVALRTGRPSDAVRAFREALGILSRKSGGERVRARLYAAIGSAEEARGKPELAYDAYRIAIGLDPTVEPARRRLREMGSAAGL